MKKISSFAACTLLLSALISSCSRPVATYQKMPVERFASHTTVAAPAEAVNQTPEVATAPARITNQEVITSPAQTAPMTSAAALKVVEKQVQEVMANNSAKIAGNKKLEKRMVRVQNMLAEASAKAAQSTSTTAPAKVASARKMNLVERMMIKRVDKKIQKTLAPKDAERASAITGLLRLGIIIGVIGLVLALIPGISVLGVILLIVGIVLILLDLLDVA